MTQEQVKKFLNEECEVVNPKQSLEEYMNAVQKYLILCEWKYSEEQAEERVRLYESDIKVAYITGKTVGDIAVNIGYSCG